MQIPREEGQALSLSLKVRSFPQEANETIWGCTRMYVSERSSSGSRFIIYNKASIVAAFFLFPFKKIFK